jgi:hypothetical protein
MWLTTFREIGKLPARRPTGSQLDDEGGLLLPLHRALVAVAATLAAGRDTHPDDAGFRLSPEFHVERARRHLELLAAGDSSEPHLAHAATRLLMAIAAK